MGSGIAQVFAQKGFPTILFDVNENALSHAREKIKKHAADIVDHIVFTTKADHCRADFVIEAIVENAHAKLQLLNNLAAVNGEKTVYATNTSSLSVNALAEQFTRSDNFLGMHFFNPAPLMKLVEVVKAKLSSETAIQFAMNLAKALDKIPVLCNDSPGFIVNRVARPYYLEALYLFEKNNVPVKDIDTLLEATGFRMGPFKLMDLIGNDINFAVSTIVYKSLGEPLRLKPSAAQEQKVNEGSLGRKSGKGYYDYSNS